MSSHFPGFGQGCTSVKNVRVKQALWVRTSTVGKMMWSCLSSVKHLLRLISLYNDDVKCSLKIIYDKKIL